MDRPRYRRLPDRTHSANIASPIWQQHPHAGEKRTAGGFRHFANVIPGARSLNSAVWTLIASAGMMCCLVCQALALISATVSAPNSGAVCTMWLVELCIVIHLERRGLNAGSGRQMHRPDLPAPGSSRSSPSVPALASRAADRGLLDHVTTSCSFTRRSTKSVSNGFADTHPPPSPDNHALQFVRRLRRLHAAPE